MISREGLREYISGSLWVAPGAASLAAIAAGVTLSRIDVDPDSRWGVLAFQGTADDARSLLTTISSTVVTVMAIVLGLTVVALQLASTQFSPRLLRNFLRDRATQAVLSMFMGTFVYSTSGLYTVGLADGTRTEEYPRLAVTVAMLLLLASLAMVVYFADHLAHSIQIDTVTGRVQANVLDALDRLPNTCEDPRPHPPPWATPVTAVRSGYIQTARPQSLLRTAVAAGVCVELRYRVGEHVIAGTPLADVWRPSPDDPAPVDAVWSRAVDESLDIGFERTLQQDIAFGMRQLVDVTCKALSAAINDPYTAIQAIDHLSVIFSAIASRPLGDHVAWDADGAPRVVVPGRRFGDYLPGMCGLIRRYGAGEPTVCLALLRLLDNCAYLVAHDPVRLAAIHREVDLLVEEAARRISHPPDVATIRRAAGAIPQT